MYCTKARSSISIDIYIHQRFAKGVLANCSKPTPPQGALSHAAPVNLFPHTRTLRNRDWNSEDFSYVLQVIQWGLGKDSRHWNFCVVELPRDGRRRETILASRLQRTDFVENYRLPAPQETAIYSSASIKNNWLWL